MKELRITQTMRVFFAFDPERTAIFLIGGYKAGKTKRFYKKMIRSPTGSTTVTFESSPSMKVARQRDAKERKKAVQQAERRGQKASRRRR